jgi:hypothetical protein
MRMTSLKATKWMVVPRNAKADPIAHNRWSLVEIDMSSPLALAAPSA